MSCVSFQTIAICEGFVFLSRCFGVLFSFRPPQWVNLVYSPVLPDTFTSPKRFPQARKLR